MPVRLVDGPSDQQLEMGERRRRSARRGYRSGTTVATLLMRLAFIGVGLTFLVVVGEVGWHLTREGDAIANEPSFKATPEAHPVSPLRMGPVSTGVAAVDDALRGFLKGDVDQALSQLVVQQVRCGTLPWGGTPALTCLAAEAPGTVHEMILSACGPKWVTAEAARAEVGTLLADTPGLYAVGRASGGYTAVLSWLDAPGRSLVLTISSLGVTSYGAGCGLPLPAKPGHELVIVTAPGG